MPKLKKKTICIYILIVVALYVVVAVIPSLTNVLTRTEVIKHGELTVKNDLQVYIVRNETVYLASQNGKPDFVVKPGTLIKRGTKLLDFKVAEDTQNNNKDQQGKDDEQSNAKYKDILSDLGDAAIPDSSYVSQMKGNLSLSCDGYESKMTPETMNKLTESDVSNMNREPVDLKTSSIVKGDPMYKIADNSNWYILCWIDQEDISKYEQGKDIKVKLPKGTVSAKIDSIKKENKKWRVIMRTNRYYKDYVELRSAEASVITSDSEGLLVSNGSLTTKGKTVGVYVKDTTGEFVFTPVQVLGTDGETTLVSEGAFYDDKGNTVNTVGIYDEVLKKPKSVK